MRIAIQTPADARADHAAAIYAANLLRALRHDTPVGDSVVACGEDRPWWGRRRLGAVDLCHHIGAAPSARADVPMIPLVHDLAPLRYPGLYSLCATREFSQFLDGIDRYAAIQTLTGFTRDELVHHTGIDPQRVSLVRPGVDALFHAPAAPEDALELQAIGLLPQQFFLSVGCLSPLGNADTLAAAYCALPQRARVLLPLVIAGARRRGALTLTPAVRAELDAGNIRLLGQVPRFLLRVLYRGALLTLFPAIYGGFGLAVAEAVVCGSPIAVSRNTALAELAGPRATCVAAMDVAAWQMVLEDHVGRGRYAGMPALANAGLVFTWETNARETRALYSRVLN